MSKINKKGFTLVEIIITLAIVVTITTVAVGSYIGISNNKKKEEWKLVKDQIETAAEQYFSSNKYMYESFDENSNITGTISIKKLVSNDYLNKIVDPRTNKEVNPCSMVTVEIYNNKFKGKYIESDVKTCSDQTAKVEFKEKNSTSGDVTFHKDTSSYEKVNETSNWYNISLLGEDKNLITCIKPKEKDIASVQIDGQDISSTTGDIGYCLKINNGTNKSISYSLTNSKGKRYIVVKEVKVDTTRPEGIINVSSARSGYNSNMVNAVVNAKDSFSNISNIIIKAVDGNQTGTLVDDSTNGWQKRLDKYNIKIADSLDGNTHVMNSVITDGAGNTKEISSPIYNVYLLCSETSSYTYTSWNNNCSNSCGGIETGDIYRYYTDIHVGSSCGSSYETSTSRSCGGGCQSTTKAPTKTTTKAATKAPTKSVCDNMGEYISISSSIDRNNNNKTKSYPEYGNGKQTIVTFKYTISNNKITTVETHAAFCKDYNTCKDVNESNRNQKSVLCNKSYNCDSGWQYVGFSIKVKCGSKTKTYYYARKIGSSKEWASY